MGEAYAITNWSELYETFRSRAKKGRLDWIKMRCKHHGSGYCRIASHRQRERIFCGFVLTAEVAATCPERGVLRGGDGRALTPQDMEFRTHFPAVVFETAWPVLVEIGWMERTGKAAKAEAPAPVEPKPKQKVKRQRKAKAASAEKPSDDEPKSEKYNGGWLWGRWVDLHRSKGNVDPAPLGRDVAAAREIAKAIPQEECMAVLEAYLDDLSAYLLGQGHALRLLPGRLNAYRNGGVSLGGEMDDAGLAAAQEAEDKLAMRKEKQ